MHRPRPQRKVIAIATIHANRVQLSAGPVHTAAVFRIVDITCRIYTAAAAYCD